jgi:hypothetical protein
MRNFSHPRPAAGVAAAPAVGDVSLFVRGFIWFGLYLLLVALPAAVAVIVDPFDAPRPALVETSVALGPLAFRSSQFSLRSCPASGRARGHSALTRWCSSIST